MNKKQIVVLCAALVVVAVIVAGIATAMIGKAPASMETPETTDAAETADIAETTVPEEQPSNGETDPQKPDREEATADGDDKEVVSNGDTTETLPAGVEISGGVVESDETTPDAPDGPGELVKPTESTSGNDTQKPTESTSGSDTQKPSDSAATEGTKPSGSGSSDASKEEVTIPTAPQGGADTTQPSQQVGPDLTTTYEEYHAMTGEEQFYFYYSFASAEDFTQWYNAVKDAYESGKDDVIIGDDGVVNAGG